MPSHVGLGARYLVSAAAGWRYGTVVAEDTLGVVIEHADGTQTRRRTDEYEVV